MLAERYDDDDDLSLNFIYRIDMLWNMKQSKKTYFPTYLPIKFDFLLQKSAESYKASSYPSRTITIMFTSGQIPLGKVWTPLSSQLWVK